MSDIKIITEPSVVVIARQTIAAEGLEFLRERHGWTPGVNHPAAEIAVEVGGRSCYQSWNRGRPHDEHIKHLITVGHGSVLEHAVWTLLVEGISRSLSHELVRHRHLSPSQLSQRYVDSADVAFVVPPLLMPAVWNSACRGPRSIRERETEPAYCFWRDSCKASLAAYAELLARIDGIPDDLSVKQKREAARAVLPNCTETKIVLTGNARAWRNLIELRCSEAADAEFRRLACKVYKVLLRESPNIFGDYARGETLPDGTFSLTTDHRKV